MSSADTIYALATPPGKSGVAVIRLSGPLAHATLERLTGVTFAPREIRFVSFRHPDTGALIDRGLAFRFKAPQSFTGEDVAELHAHGSLAIIHELYDALMRSPGLRPAERGEFTHRAFVNGKMDLTEAEGLADLIDAETREQKNQALGQLGGRLSNFYDGLRTRIVNALAHLEAYIDFPDEDIPQAVLSTLENELRAASSEIDRVLSDEKRGERLRSGVSVVILGAPNAGKSSLLNALAGRDAAIVSHRAGTTRDVIEIHLDIAGYPVVLVDTAGLRNSDDEIEMEGIRRALERAASADLKLVLFDGANWPTQDDASINHLGPNSVTIVSKADLIKNKATDSDAVFLSTKTGEGIDLLLKEIEKRVVGFFSSESAPLITRQRHRALLVETSALLKKAQQNIPLELKCEELRRAGLAVGKITGKIQVDDVLDVIFRSFCIGK